MERIAEEEEKQENTPEQQEHPELESLRSNDSDQQLPYSTNDKQLLRLVKLLARRVGRRVLESDVPYVLLIATTVSPEYLSWSLIMFYVAKTLRKLQNTKL